jgi:hypothetical protein
MTRVSELVAAETRESTDFLVNSLMACPRTQSSEDSSEETLCFKAIFEETLNKMDEDERRIVDIIKR